MRSEIRLSGLCYLRWLRRFDRGTAYPEQIEAIAAEVRCEPLRGRTAMIIDAMGVGDMGVDYARRLGLSPMPVKVIGEGRPHSEARYYYLPKRDMVQRISGTRAEKRLNLDLDHPLLPVLRKEVENFRIKFTNVGHDTYGAWRENEHDDLVFALGLACWWTQFATPAEMEALGRQAAQGEDGI